MDAIKRLQIIDKLQEYTKYNSLEHDSHGRKFKAIKLILEVMKKNDVTLLTTKENYYLITKVIDVCKEFDITLRLKLYPR